MKELVDALHIFLCKTDHVYDMMKFSEQREGLCYYYLECDIADGENMRDHLKWKDVAKHFKEHLNLSSDREAMEFIKKAVELSKNLQDLVGDNTDRMAFVRELMR